MSTGNIWNDVGFVITLVGALLITILVALGKLPGETLVAWLGGAAGPSFGRWSGLRRQPPKEPPP